MGREEEREGDKHQCVVALQVPPTGELARNPGTLYSDWELNQRPFGSQAGIQSTEPHQPEISLSFFLNYICDEVHVVPRA